MRHSDSYSISLIAFLGLEIYNVKLLLLHVAWVLFLNRCAIFYQKAGYY